MQGKTVTIGSMGEDYLVLESKTTNKKDNLKCSPLHHWRYTNAKVNEQESLEVGGALVNISQSGDNGFEGT